MKALTLKTPTDKLRSRFMRWLGQICKDENYTRLLESNYNAWFYRTRSAQGFPLNALKIDVTPCSLKIYWKNAIKRASLEQLQQLDILVLDDKLEKRR